MRIALFYHSVISDWNNGHAHFLRGYATELVLRGHDVRIYEPANAWSVENLVREHGHGPLDGFRAAYPLLRSIRYDVETFDVDVALDGVDLAVVHEWNDTCLVRRIGETRRSSPRLRLLFHDSHHRVATDAAGMARYDLSNYDGVLAFGSVVREIYVREGWAENAWTWHEAADVRVFKPLADVAKTQDIAWIGNWGDEERTGELTEFLLGPAHRLGLTGVVHGVRYPPEGLRAVTDAGLTYAGWIPNHEVPRVFATSRVTVHVPRRSYATALPGIPTIRPFEALACGIPLVSAPWRDEEQLFTAGRDYLVARNGAEMQSLLREVLSDAALGRELAQHGRETILARHTCAHRVDELLSIHAGLTTATALRDAG